MKMRHMTIVQRVDNIRICADTFHVSAVLTVWCLFLFVNATLYMQDCQTEKIVPDLVAEIKRVFGLADTQQIFFHDPDL